MRHIAGTLLIMLAIIFAYGLLMTAAYGIVYALQHGIEPLPTWFDPVGHPMCLAIVALLFWLGAVLSRPKT